MASQLPRIRISDPSSQDQTGFTDSPSSPDGKVAPRPKTSSFESHQHNGGRKSPTKLLRNPQGKSAVLSKSSTPPPEHPPTVLDPLSHHILKRTNTESTIPQKLRTSTRPDSPGIEAATPGTDGGTSINRHQLSEPVRTDSNPLKEKKKGVSFLSRFSIMSGKRRDAEDGNDDDDDDDELGDSRTEGMNAHVFSSSVGANGYIPQHKEPPRYIKVRQHNKKEREFNRMFLAQELNVPKQKPGDNKAHATKASETHPRPSMTAGGAIWATEFSKDGKYLAAAGHDTVVRVWSVISTAEEREAHESDEDASSGKGERLSAPVFRSRPVREFDAHKSVVLDLSWSKNNFLLSSSMDKTVRLWHVSRQECLCTFKHKDFVTSIAFHPRDDRFFLAGSLDSVLRLWSIPDKTVAFWNQLPDLITAVAFSPDGKTAMAGVLNGYCLFYETEGLKYHTQIHVRSSRGKNAKGSKITGIRTCVYPPNDLNGEIKVLITSNDSRVRLYNLRDKILEMKFKGHENSCSQIKASFSDDTRYIICGSEDRKTFIWSTGSIQTDTKEKQPVEVFEAHSDIVTTAVMAPLRTRQLLSCSGDPIYDLCNPPPVMLLSREESTVSTKILATVDSEKNGSEPVAEVAVKKPDESPAYLARSQHADGNIIITADHTGSIKVFRQDCAYQKRHHSNALETGSTFSRRIGTGMLGRSGSMMTRGSVGSHSRRDSISLRSTSTQFPTDRILSWRNSITSSVSMDGGNSVRTAQASTRSDRSVSPGKFTRPSAIQADMNPTTTAMGTMRQQSYGATATTSSTTSRSPSTSMNVSNPVSQPPTPSFVLQSAGDENPLKLDVTGKSYQFWNRQNWRNQTSTSSDPKGLGSDLDRRISGSLLSKTNTTVSKLTDEESGSSGMDEANGGESEDEIVACKRCGGRDFQAKRSPGKVGKKLVCTQCGTTIE
ncbi:MAG: hypothetical protein M1818_008141 [Claussenomyces sp. TS43310]|nr:MAG: hypothetical protein M1818_008141 [Claussenomyces sp. TS43310]